MVFPLEAAVHKYIKRDNWYCEDMLFVLVLVMLQNMQFPFLSKQNVFWHIKPGISAVMFRDKLYINFVPKGLVVT